MAVPLCAAALLPAVALPDVLLTGRPALRPEVSGFSGTALVLLPVPTVGGLPALAPGATPGSVLVDVPVLALMLPPALPVEASVPVVPALVPVDAPDVPAL